MFTPSLAEVQQLAATYTMVPVKCTLLADQETPIRLYQKFRSQDSFLLESVEGGAHWARYSFIGLDPFLRMEAHGQQIELVARDGKRETLTANPIEWLRQEMKRFRSPQLPGFPRLTGGAVGFFGYQTLHYYEQIPKHPQETLSLPDLRFLFVDQLIAFDHLKQEIQLIVHLRAEANDTAEQLAHKYQAACERLRQLALQASTGPAETEDRLLYSLDDQPSELMPKANMERERFEQMVEQAKAYIAAGDIFQVVLSQRFEMATSIDPFAVYRVLRRLNPSPYMYYLQYAGETIVGTSPELLVRVEDGEVEMRPIAGTRKRGANPAEDASLAAELRDDSKELAEHTMLLDLGRNDVGRVSTFGSVRVKEQMVIEHYSHVMHLVSHVSGKLRNGLDPFDALLSAFPAGTVSGAPKLRAMEIIAQLEQEARHIYAGAIGYLSFTGNLDSCITIRTLLFKDGVAYVQAGAGVVADSVPAHEYQETLNKAAGMIRAVQRAEQLFRQGVGEPC